VISEAQPSAVAAPRAATRRLPALALAHPVAARLGGLILVSAVIRFLLALWMPAPWIFADELKYSELAKSLAATGHFAIRDVPGSGVGPLYPVLISPAYALFESVPHAYVLVKAINAVLMSLAAVPGYLLARRLLTRSWSLVAAGLALAVPSMVYTGTVMTENIFYPLFLTSSLGIVLALERPSARRQLGALGLIALTFLARPQAVVLVPAFVTAIVAVVLVDAFDEPGRARTLAQGLRRYLPTWVGLIGGLVALTGWESLRGRSALALFGDAENLWRQHYSVLSVGRWFVYHVAELDLYVGVLPFAALLLLLGFGLSRRDREVRIFALASVSLVLWLLLAVAFFTADLTRYDSNAVSHVEDRYTFYAAPLLVIALLAWASRRVAGSARATGVAAAAAGLLVLVLPLRDLIHNNAVPDALALLPWSIVRSNGAIVARPHATALFAVVVLSLAALFYLLRATRLAWLPPALVLLAFVAVSTTSERMFNAVASNSASSIQSNRDWVDEAIGPKSEAVVFWPARGDPHLVWENEFFNRSVGRIYYTRTPSWAGLPEQHVTLRRDGRLFPDGSREPVRARYLLADPSVVPVTGHLVAVDQTSGMRLFAVGSGGGRSVVRIAR
jgi:hypothetical protein